MNAPEFAGTEPGVQEQRSSVEINLTAKGTRQWRVKVYAIDGTDDAIETAYAKAVELEGRLAREYGLGEAA